ncbi:MAG: hypothetical protein IPM96_01975 [Ignavibacteria bacterium]|nr:hypothetical protein [Ignavibacteria bacterium]
MKKKVYKYENIIQKYLRRSFRIKTDKEMTDMFKEMKYELNVLLKDPLEKMPLTPSTLFTGWTAKSKKSPSLKS